MASDYISQCPRHYTPYPTPLSTGVNFFAHNPRYDDRGGGGGKLLLFSPYIPHWPRNSTPIILQGEGNRYNPRSYP